MRKLYIVVDGGIVQGVCAHDPAAFADVEVVLIDYDTDGADPDDVSQVAQGDGTTADGVVYALEIDKAEIPEITLV